MRRWTRWLVAVLATTVFTILLVPELWITASKASQRLTREIVDAVSRPIPQPVLVGVGLIVLLIISFTVIFWIVRLFTSVGASRGERIAVWYDRITPGSPQTKALVFMVVFVVVFVVGVGVVTPWLATALTEDTGIGDVVSDIHDGRYGSDMSQLYADDAVTPDTGAISTKGENDTDGDGLPDAWERAGETPGGASLPGASPERLDLYVQLDYGDNVSVLDARETRRLKAVWASMPVENPDGSTGVDIHLLDAGDRAGKLDREIRIRGSAAVDRFYTEDRLRARLCVYREVMLGHVTSDTTVGFAEAPGYAVAYDGSRFDGYDGSEPYRVAMLTHGLLHTVVGSVDGGVHTDSGWLEYPGDANEYLSDTVASKLERDGFASTAQCRRSANRTATG